MKWTSPLSKYWIIHRVGLGKCQGKEILEAKEFLSREFLDLSGGECSRGELSGGEEVRDDRKIVARLWRIYKSESPEQALAELCLRCVISHYLKNYCYELKQQYGKKHNFEEKDLLPFVLDCNDLSLLLSNSKNKSLTVRILETFDPEKGSLSAWVQRKVIGDFQLKMFLLENGLELRTNWSLLKECTISKLQHILSDFHRYEPKKIQQFTKLLESYQTVYLAQIQAARNEINREQEQGLGRKEIDPPLTPARERKEIDPPLVSTGKRKEIDPPPASSGKRKEIDPPLASSGKRKEIDPPLTPPRRGRQIRYPEPNCQQLFSMSEQLSTTWKLSPKGVLKELQNLAKLIREYRVSRGKSVATQALGKTEDILASPQVDEDNEENQFITAFSQQYDDCFIKAVQEVIEGKISYYRNKKKPKDKQLIQALRLYHCRMVSMGEIAPQIGLQKQYQVSRLLEQTKIRADIARKIVSYLIPEIFQILPEDISLEKRRELRTELPQILMEKVNEEMEQAQKEDSVSKNRTMDSKLSQVICQYLDEKFNI